jgi:anti-sigma factor ChrR (cupin superfamily)
MLKEQTILVSRHPTALLQSEYAGGLCSAGAGLAVAVHLELCRRCARAFELPGDTTSSAGPHIGPSRHDRRSGKLPGVLSKIRLGPWHGPVGGARSAAIRNVSSLGEAVYLVETPNGELLALPKDAELVVVVEGVIQDGLAKYLRGDFLDLAAEGVLQPRGGAPSGCLCLVVSGEVVSEEESAAAD